MAARLDFLLLLLGIAHGLQLCPLLTCSTRATKMVSLRTRSARAAAAEHVGEAGADGSSPVALKHEQLPSNDDNEGRLLRIRHSTAHVLAMAVQKLFKGTKVSIGPWIENGFYYDFDPPEPFQEKDLRRIKKEMDKIISYKWPFTEEEVTREEAERRIREQDEPYKLEILNRIESDRITIWHTSKNQDGWWDLCAGPHVAHTGELPKDSIELESIAGAYFFGDESRPMLQRIYGTAWETPAQLEEHKRLRAEAVRRDHRRIGKDLSLFSIQPSAGGGLVFWHPKGARIRALMEDYWKRTHIQSGYELLFTPHMASIDLWKTSGHFDFYKDDMFDQMQVEGDDYQIKPMNCPFHVLVFKDTPRSYRDLPIRWAELGTVYRYERSGALNGLFRVRGFTQDDAHIFCLPEQLTDEIVGVLHLTENILTKFGFTDYEIMLSTRPEKSVGSDAIWEKATSALEEALAIKGWKYGVDEGGGAFYGPKIDLKIKDAIGRTWQCSTIQADFNLPDRFVGVLIESTAGDFPLWLAPTQLRLLPVSDKFLPYCKEVQALGKALGLRVEVDPGGRSLSKQIKIANKEKVPVYGVVGAKEVEERTLSLNLRKGDGTGLIDLGTVPLEDAVNRMELATKSDTPLASLFEVRM